MSIKKILLCLCALLAACSSNAVDIAEGQVEASVPNQDVTTTADDEVPTTASSTTTTSTTTTTSAPLPLVDACTTERLSAIGAQNGTVVSRGNEYNVQWTVPSIYDGSAVPVVLDLHAIGSNGAQQSVLSGFSALAETEGFVAVHPTGISTPEDDRNSWELPQFDTELRDDVVFVTDLLDFVGTQVCVDQNRIYSTGMSNGGLFTSELVCSLADRIAAAVSVAGVNHPADCEPSRAVPYLAFHGTADTVVPFNGGGESTLTGADEAAEFFEQVIPDEFAEFADDFGCGEPSDVSVTENVSRREWADCDDAVEVAFYTVTDGGHTWPGSPVSAAIPALGATTLEVDATAIAWAFFQRNTLNGES